MRSECVHDLLVSASECLRIAGIDTPTLDSAVLLSHATGLSRTQLTAHPEAIPTRSQHDLFLRSVEARAKRTPLAYIIGHWGFYGLEFEVGPAVLIPRPDTETLVETAIGLLEGKPCTAADIGVGSGAIAVALAVSLPEARVYGTDASEDALEIAARNAERHGVGHKVRLSRGDLFDSLEVADLDAVVSNPPYIPSGDIPHLQPEVALYEPRGALDGGPDGLDYYRRIVPDARGHLRPGGSLLVEVGAGQSPEVLGLFREHGYTEVRSVKDLAGIERVVQGRIQG